MDPEPPPPATPVPTPPGSAPRALREARTVATVLDDLVRIPGTRFRVGLDPLLGLLPGLGDWITWVASAHLLVAGARMGAPAPVLLRMAGNALIDAVVGAVPLLGDLFDLGWKANRRNLLLLERLVADRGRAERASRLMVGAVLAATFGVLAGAAVGALLLFRWLVGLLGTAA